MTEFDRAIQTFSKAILLESDYMDAYLCRGFIYNIIGKHGLAVEDFTKVIQLVPNHASAHSNRGLAFLHLQEWEKAKSDLITAKDLGADILAAFHNNYASVEDFEQKTGIQLPEDIAAMLTPS